MSVKNDQWKPVKLIARHSLEGLVIDSSSSHRGNLVVVLTDSNISIFINRELAENIQVTTGGKKVVVADDASRIIVLSSDSLTCYTRWGEVKWKINIEINEESIFVNKNTENKIRFSVGNNLKTVNRFGEIESIISLDSDIISLSESDSNIAVLTQNSITL